MDSANTGRSRAPMDPQLQQIYRRLKTSSVEERSAIFADLKKTPHLFAAYLKISQANRAGPDMPLPADIDFKAAMKELDESQT